MGETYNNLGFPGIPVISGALLAVAGRFWSIFDTASDGRRGRCGRRGLPIALLGCHPADVGAVGVGGTAATSKKGIYEV